MMSETVMGISVTENRNAFQAAITGCVIYPPRGLRQSNSVLNTVELLARLDERGIRNVDVAHAINVSPSRVTEIKKGERAIKLDEAFKLVEAFDLESPQGQPAHPLPAAVARLVVRYIALETGSPLARSEADLEELAEDVRAFVEFVADPKVRDSVEAAEAFFQAMRLRRPRPALASPPGSDPEHAA